MRRYFTLLIIISIIIVVACKQENAIENNPENETPLESDNDYPIWKSDYFNVFILEVKGSSIVVASHPNEPDASYGAKEIFVDQHTIIDGARQSFIELRKDDDLRIWVEDINAIKEIADKIFVFK